MNAHNQLPMLIIGKDFPNAVIALLEDVQRSVDIIVYDWRLYEGQPKHPVMRFTRALQDALARGVKVRCIVGNERLMAMLKARGFEVKNRYSERLLHAKMILLDGEVAVIGSHNYTQGAFTMNYELSMALNLGHKAPDLQKWFDGLWGVDN